MSYAPRYAYQRRGGPLLSWAGGPPSAARSATVRALGSLDFDHPPTNVLGLPMPGAPEFLSGYEAIPSSSPPIGQRGVGGVDCHCGGSCGCSGGLGDDISPGTTRAINAGLAALLAYHATKNRKGGGLKWVELGLAAVLGYKAVKG